MHRRVPLSKNIRSNKPRRRKPCCSREAAEKKEVKFILLLSASTTRWRDVNREAASSHARRQSPPKKSPSKSLNTREQTFLLPNELEKVFQIQRNIHRGISRIIMKLLEAKLVSRFRRANTIWGEIPTQQIRTIIINNFSVNNLRRKRLLEKRKYEIMIPTFLTRQPKLPNKRGVNKTSLLGNKRIINSMPQITPRHAP